MNMIMIYFSKDMLHFIYKQQRTSMKILVTHDFITTRVHTHKHLEHFLSPILDYLGCLVDFLSSTQLFDLRENLSLHCDENLITHFNLNKFDNRSRQYLFEFASSYDVIIIFEASLTLRTLFEQINVKYLDMWVAPIRFTKDIMFSMYSNDKHIQSILEENKLADAKIFTIAQRIQDQANHFFVTPDIKLQDNSALLIGQLLMDKSVMKNGRFLTLLDYKKQIVALAKNYSKIYFLRHPLMNESEFGIILDGLNDVRNIEYIYNINTYYLLSRCEITTVVAISSSVLIEARYFNKKSIFLFKPVLSDEYQVINTAIYTTIFWKTIFGLETKNKDIEYLVHNNYMRHNFDLYYAYKDFMNDFSNERSYRVIGKLFSFCENLDLNKKYVLYGYGSVGRLILPMIKESVIGIIDKGLIVTSNIDGIPIISIDDINEKMNVIVSPYIYANEIILNLTDKGCNIFIPLIYNDKETHSTRVSCNDN